ncbi:MAG TPA: hypothetical protein VKE51_11980 [Vicinamibacterales bacterium]|nr:hypothetical protein [Vicinamibacterales bacterium]
MSNPFDVAGDHGDDAGERSEIIRGADARLWGVLRTGMNDLARVYGVPLLAI